MKKKILSLAALAFIVAAFSFMLHQHANAPVLGDESIVLRAPDGHEEMMTMEIADNKEERAKGLMQRKSLPAGTGMLFVYDHEQQLGFWMKNTLIPLDILFFDESGQFVSRTTMDPCYTDSCETYASSGPARYALEVNRGEKKTDQVGKGWILWLSK